MLFSLTVEWCLYETYHWPKNLIWTSHSEHGWPRPISMTLRWSNMAGKCPTWRFEWEKIINLACSSHVWWHQRVAANFQVWLVILFIYIYIPLSPIKHAFPKLLFYGFQTNPSGEIGNDLPVLPKPSRANCSRAEKPSRNRPTFQVYIYICFFSYVTVMIFPYQWIAGKIDTGNPSNFPKNLDLIVLFPRSRAISWPCQSAVEDTPERSVAPFRVGHFKAWRTELTWPWPLGVWICVFSMNLGVY